jgi:hypothetical protein
MPICIVVWTAGLIGSIFCRLCGTEGKGVGVYHAVVRPIGRDKMIVVKETPLLVRVAE